VIATAAAIQAIRAIRAIRNPGNPATAIRRTSRTPVGMNSSSVTQPHNLRGHGEAPEQRYKLDDLWLNRDTPDTERAITTIDGAEASRNDTDVGFELARRTDG